LPLFFSKIWKHRSQKCRGKYQAQSKSAKGRGKVVGMFQAIIIVIILPNFSFHNQGSDAPN